MYSLKKRYEPMKIKLKTKEQLREENLAKIENFCLFDDTFLTAVLTDEPELVQTILRIIMRNDGLIVKSSKTQKPLKNINGRSVTLDVDAILEDGTECNIEVQQESSGARPKRARFHSSMMDASMLFPSENYENLLETYVIFITLHDCWGKGKPLYTINRHIEELDMQPFYDDAHIIYVNGEYTGDTPIGKLMHDFRCKDPNHMYYKDLAAKAFALKETEGGKDKMCKIIEESVAEGRKQEAYQIALKMLAKGKISFDEIAEYSGLTLEEVKELSTMVSTNA